MGTAEHLLEHATWLRQLAASLVGDRSAADDLVQETYVAALRHPPDTSRPVRPWLARVVRNAARFRWRGDTHRAAREAAVIDDAVAPTSEELLARHQLQQLLAKLVAELADPYRTAILLRYAEGLEPAQIARKLDIPAGTVRWRIAEGLERLRRGLDDEHDGDRKTWLLALVPLALWPRASHAAPIAKLAALVIAAAAVILVVAVTRPSAARPGNGTPLAAHIRAIAAHVEPAVTSWFVQPGSAPRHVTGRVIRAGAPVADAVVRLVADDAEPLEQRTTAGGRFDFGEQPAREIALGTAARGELGAIRHIDLRDPTIATDIELELQPCPAWITGTVTDAIGSPIAGAQILREGVIGVETDDRGMYELCALPTAALVGQLDVVVRASGYGTVVAGVAPTGRIRRDFVLAPEATIAGTAAPGAALWIEPDRDDRTPSSERAGRHVALADGDGRFHFANVSGGRYRLGGAARGAIAAPQLVSVAAGDTADVTVRMIPAATVHGRVTMHGKPIAGARVAVATSRLVARHDDPARDFTAAGQALSRADGTFVLDGVPPGPTQFSADPLHVTTPPIDLVAGDNTIVLEGEPLGRIRGVVRRHGVPVPFARVDMNGPTARGVTTDARGAFDFAGLEPGRYGFYADDQRRGAYFIHDAVALGPTETLDLDLELAWGARISGRVVDRDGAPVPNVNVRFASPHGEHARCSADTAGTFTCGSMHGGELFTPSVFAGDDTSRSFPFAITPVPIRLDDDASVDNIRLVIDPRTYAIAGTVVDETRTPAVDVRVRATGTGSTLNAWTPAPSAITDISGHFRITGLAPGDYDLVAETMHDTRAAERTVTTGTADAQLQLAPPARCGTAELPALAHRPDHPIVWDDRVELVGWTLPDHAVANTTVEVVLAFRVRAPLVHSWDVFAHFDSATQRRNGDHSPPCPTSRWRAGDVVVDRFTTTFVATGRYVLRIGFFRFPDGDGPWLNLVGPGDTTGIELGTITAD